MCFLQCSRRKNNFTTRYTKPAEYRVSYVTYPFEVTWLDYAGLLFAKDVNQKDMNKCYILLFTCTATRAVHLELTPDQGSSTLLLALRRFNSRRGVNKMFISDNFKSFKTKEVLAYLREKLIEWKFILEKSQWWGGFYERLIGLTKISILKTIFYNFIRECIFIDIVKAFKNSGYQKPGMDTLLPMPIATLRITHAFFNPLI